jgi:hypothetical protein
MDLAKILLVVDALLVDCRRSVRRIELALSRVDPRFSVELEVSDANRGYASLWEQLRDVRARLATLGRDVSQFDRMCAGLDDLTVVYVEYPEPVVARTIDHLDSLTSERTTEHVYRHAPRGSARSYGINTEGLSIAERASAALKAAMPEHDWAALAAESDAAAAELHVPIDYKMVLILGLGLLLLFGFVVATKS